MIDYALSRHNLHIPDSYKVQAWDIPGILREIRREDDASASPSLVFDRSIFSLTMEWICHNALYFLGYQRDRTKDVDLDNPCDRPEWHYILAGLAICLVPFVLLLILLIILL